MLNLDNYHRIRAWIIEGTLDSATTFIDPIHCGELVGGYRGQRVTCSRFNAIIHKPYHLHQIGIFL